MSDRQRFWTWFLLVAGTILTAGGWFVAGLFAPTAGRTSLIALSFGGIGLLMLVVTNLYYITINLSLEEQLEFERELNDND